MKQLNFNKLELRNLTFVLTLFLTITHFDRVYGYAHLAKNVSGNQKMITEVFSTENLDVTPAELWFSVHVQVFV